MDIVFLVRLNTFVLLLVLSFICKAVNNEQKDLEFILQKSFDQISLAKLGLEYPHTEHTLNKCIQYNDKQCLRAYNEVMEGKKMIQSVSSTNALETTLDIIERACLSKDENMANFTCYGGIISLYFYNSPEQDARILERIKIYPKTIRNIIFSNEFFWFYNRSNKDVWVNAISAMDIDWENDIHKQFILSLFKKSIEEADSETWVLR